VSDESAFGRVGRLLADLTAGAVVAGYRLEARIGAGGMAVVFRARDERLGRTVALKVLTPGLAGDREFRERFIRESQRAAAVDHPHIIPVYGAGEADGILYLAMRHVSGGDLRAVLHREGPLRADRAAFLLSPVASALDAAHAAGLVHRDVKPANVLVDMSRGRPDHPYLSDFGLAKGAASMSGLTGTGQFLGTADYAAPEQIRGRPPQAETDQYALACVAFTMLTGVLAFARPEPMAVLWAHLNDPPPLATARRPDLSPAVDQVLGRALAKDPAARYPSCGAFADALRAALGVAPYSVPGPAYPGQPVPGMMPMPAPGAHPRGGSRARAWRLPIKSQRRWLGALAAAMVSLVVVIAVVLHPRPGKPQQVSGRSRSPAAARQAGSPDTASTSAAASLVGNPGRRAAVTGPPVRFPNPGLVPSLAVALPQDGSLVAVGANGTVYTWDTTAHQVTSEMAAPRKHVFIRAAISPDGDSMAAQDSSGATYLFNGSPQPDSALAGGDRIYRGSMDVGGLTVATGDPARTGVDVWETLQSSPIETLINPDHGADITSVALNGDAQTVAASDASGRTYVWNADPPVRHTQVLRPSDGSVVNCSVFAQAGNSLLVTGNRDGRAYLWDTTTGHLLNFVREPGRGVGTVAINFFGNVLATAGTGNAVYLWDASTGASLGKISDPGGRGVNSLALSDGSSVGSAGTQLAVADKNGSTYLWTLAG